MNKHLQYLESLIRDSEALSVDQKEVLLKSIKEAGKEMEIIRFKLDRTEKVKRTTAILLEETIAELEEKRKAVEESNNALQKSLEELKSAQSQLIQSEKMASLGELTAGIAHEIQNPLNFVNNFAEINQELSTELLEEAEKGNTAELKLLAHDIRDNSQKISQHGKRADAIVKGMLQHSRSTNGQKEPTDINALCDEYLRLSYHGLRARDKSFQAEMTTAFDPSIGKIRVIPQDFGRVLLNLINNAFYAVQERSSRGEPGYQPRVSIETRKTAEQLEIRVIDNGSGIPEEIRNKIFQPFFTTKPTGQGTGLGLSLSYDIIKMHKGEIRVESKEGEGTVFCLQLPSNG